MYGELPEVDALFVVRAKCCASLPGLAGLQAKSCQVSVPHQEAHMRLAWLLEAALAPDWKNGDLLTELVEGVRATGVSLLPLGVGNSSP